MTRDASARRLERPRPWAAVVAANSVVFTLFLWHMPAVVVTTLLLDRLGVLSTAPGGSPEWWAWRVPWVLVLAVVLTAMVAVVGRVEQRTRRTAPAHPTSPAARRVRGITTAAGYVTAVLGMLSISWAGPGVHGPLGLSTAGVVTWAVGATLLRVARTRMAQPTMPSRASRTRAEEATEPPS